MKNIYFILSILLLITTSCVTESDPSVYDQDDSVIFEKQVTVDDNQQPELDIDQQSVDNDAGLDREQNQDTDQNPIQDDAEEPVDDVAVDIDNHIPDTKPPRVTNITPAHESTGVALAPQIAITFDEIIDESTIADSLILKNSNSEIISGTIALSVSNKITFEPQNNLLEEHSYTVEFKPVVSDIAGNKISDNQAKTWTFTTGKPPVVVSHYPESEAADVPNDVQITVTFDQAMSASTMNNMHIVLLDETGIVTTETRYDSDKYSLTIIPESHLKAGSYNVRVKNSVKNSNGMHMSEEFTWSFTTALIAGIYPESDEVDVPQQTNISTVFADRMNKDSINNTTFVVKNNAGTPVDGTVTTRYLYDASDSNIIGAHAYFKSSQPLIGGEIYTVVLSDQIEKQNGEKTNVSKNWSFTVSETRVVADNFETTVFPVLNSADNKLYLVGGSLDWIVRQIGQDRDVTDVSDRHLEDEYAWEIGVPHYIGRNELYGKITIDHTKGTNSGRVMGTFLDDQYYCGSYTRPVYNNIPILVPQSGATVEFYIYARGYSEHDDDWDFDDAAVSLRIRSTAMSISSSEIIEDFNVEHSQIAELFSDNIDPDSWRRMITSHSQDNTYSKVTVDIPDKYNGKEIYFAFYFHANGIHRGIDYHLWGTDAGFYIDDFVMIKK